MPYFVNSILKREKALSQKNTSEIIPFPLNKLNEFIISFPSFFYDTHLGFLPHSYRMQRRKTDD